MFMEDYEDWWREHYEDSKCESCGNFHHQDQLKPIKAISEDDLKVEIKKDPIINRIYSRDTVISKDDITNIKISLSVCKDVSEFINQI